MTHEERVEMLVCFVRMAMQEDCTGVALSEDMEKVERYVAAYDWLQKVPEGTLQEVIDEEKQNMLDIEEWWMS